jgi:large subunit ribosomal protein L25
MKLQAKSRKARGKKNKALRRQGSFPAILYGGEKEAQPLTLNKVEFEKVYREAGESTIIDLDIDGKEEKVLVADVQYSPLGKLIHTDLQRVEAGEKLTTTVAIETKGESPAVKSGEGILLPILDEVEIECLPQDLPSEIKIDISSLSEVGQGIEIKDLPIDQTKVKILGHEPDEMVLKIDYPEMEEEKEEEPVSEEEAVAAVEAEKEKPEEEGALGEEEGKKEEPPQEEKPKGEKNLR